MNYIKIFFSIIILSFLFIKDIKCQELTNQEEIENIFELELEKWKLELFLNGEVGPPCEKDYNKWAKKYPQYYWGLQPINSKYYDANNDGVEDVLFYFPAVNCVGGNSTASDFSLVVYSHNGGFLTNKNIKSIVDSRIREEFYRKSISTEFERIDETIFRITDFKEDIKGNYSIWVNGDAHCCPKYKGTFSYNPFTFKVKISLKKK
ncbi:MAG: hypothetical protein QXG00_08285 [Candidatus Woesearchaeota archaeon]